MLRERVGAADDVEPSPREAGALGGAVGARAPAGAASGGVIIAVTGYGGLSWVGLAWMCASLAASLWAARRMRASAHA